MFVYSFIRLLSSFCIIFPLVHIFVCVTMYDNTHLMMIKYPMVNGAHGIKGFWKVKLKVNMYTFY